MSDEKITDLQLPIAVINRLIKEAIPSGSIAKNDAKLAIARAASVFVLFLTSATTDITSAANQKTMTAQHVLKALKEIEFENFIPELEIQLENYRKRKKDRKSINDPAAENTENVEDDIEVIEDE